MNCFSCQKWTAAPDVDGICSCCRLTAEAERLDLYLVKVGPPLEFDAKGSLDVKGDEALAAAYAEGANDVLETFREEVAVLRAVAEAAWKLMDAEPPCHCGEMAPGPCCGACRFERELRCALQAWVAYKEKAR